MTSKPVPLKGAHYAGAGDDRQPLGAHAESRTSTGATIGNQVFFDVTWQVGRHLTIGAAYVHFNAGETITQAGGSNVDLFTLQGTFRFWSRLG